jgi:hypothetical protein
MICSLGASVARLPSQERDSVALPALRLQVWIDRTDQIVSFLGKRLSTTVEG